MTAEELFLVPGDDHKYELVKGTLVRMPPAGARHGKISARVVQVLEEYVDAHGGGTVCGTDTGFILQRNPDIVRGPDAAFVAENKIPPTGEPESFWSLAPDLAVEVLSPRDRTGDLREKIAEYFEAGTRRVWVIDPHTRTVAVHRSPSEVRVLTASDVLAGEDVLPGLACPVRRLFE
jgi:Uma2 family endonuclease